MALCHILFYLLLEQVVQEIKKAAKAASFKTQNR
jgi:hypothetical protein